MPFFYGSGQGCQMCLVGHVECTQTSYNFTRSCTPYSGLSDLAVPSLVHTKSDPLCHLGSHTPPYQGDPGTEHCKHAGARGGRREPQMLSASQRSGTSL